MNATLIKNVASMRLTVTRNGVKSRVCASGCQRHTFNEFRACDAVANACADRTTGQSYSARKQCVSQEFVGHRAPLH